MTDELEGQELSDYNATQSAIQALCVKRRKCWKEDPGTCPSAQHEMPRNLCTLYKEPVEKLVEVPNTVALICPTDNKPKPLSRCYECFKNKSCPKFTDYIKEQAK